MTEMSSELKIPQFNISIEGDNFPHQTFMSWFKEKYKKNIEIDIKGYPYPKLNQHLSDYITSNDTYSWNNEDPIIISVQTGIGKNYFIAKQLLRNLLINHRSKDAMLILVNRVALSRQNKFYLADLLKYLVGNFQYEYSLKNFFQNEGIDSLCIDFGAVTICTYHQCYKQKILQQKNFDYIICDECHFFTSDSTFNPETDLILEDIVKNGHNSVRIYMSATPEVALEPIIIAEYELKKISVTNRIREQVRHIPDSAFDLIKLNYRMNPRCNPVEEIIDSNGYLHSIYSQNDIENVLNSEYENLKITFKYYYVARNYNYLNFQSKYSELEELVPYIEQSAGKWLIFINNKNQAEKFKNTLKAKNIDCEFISRNSVKENDKAKEEYDYLIENETFRSKVLISTSVIDNGINIKNDHINKTADKVLNIAVDATSRTQFLQMIGRVRVSENETIDLYIRDYGIEELKKIVSQETKILTTILYNDFLNRKGKQDIFDKQLFRYVDDDNFSTYNICAVYQLVNNISSLLNIIRNTEPDFYIKTSTDVDPIREQVYLHYVHDTENSWDKIWSRSVVDIIESENDTATRQKCKEEEFSRNVQYDRFNSTITSTFTNYIFSELLVDFINKLAEQEFESLLNFPAFNRARYNKWYFRKQNEKKSSTLSMEDRLEILKLDLPENAYIKTFESRYNDFKDEIEHFKWLTDNKETTLIEAQCKWLERIDLLEEITSNNKENLDCYDSIEGYILTHHVTTENFEKNKCGHNNAKCDTVFLESHAIKKGSSEELNLSTKYFDEKPLTNLLKMKKEWKIENFRYKFESILSKKDNTTYYLFVQYPI